MFFSSYLTIHFVSPGGIYTALLARLSFKMNVQLAHSVVDNYQYYYENQNLPFAPEEDHLCNSMAVAARTYRTLRKCCFTSKFVKPTNISTQPSATADLGLAEVLFS